MVRQATSGLIDALNRPLVVAILVMTPGGMLGFVVGQTTLTNDVADLKRRLAEVEQHDTANAQRLCRLEAVSGAGECKR